MTNAFANRIALWIPATARSIQYRKIKWNRRKLWLDSYIFYEAAEIASPLAHSAPIKTFIHCQVHVLPRSLLLKLIFIFLARKKSLKYEKFIYKFPLPRVSPIPTSVRLHLTLGVTWGLRYIVFWLTTRMREGMELWCDRFEALVLFMFKALIFSHVIRASTFSFGSRSALSFTSNSVARLANESLNTRTRTRQIFITIDNHQSILHQKYFPWTEFD